MKPMDKVCAMGGLSLQICWQGSVGDYLVEILGPDGAMWLQTHVGQYTVDLPARPFVIGRELGALLQKKVKELVGKSRQAAAKAPRNDSKGREAVRPRGRLVRRS